MPDGTMHTHASSQSPRPPYSRMQAMSVSGAKPEADSDPARWAALMARVQKGDRGAFAELFTHFAPRVKAYLVKTGTSPAQAEDCVQDVMATLWRKAAYFDPARASLATWVFTVARNRRIDLYRRVRPEPEDLPWGPEPEPAQEDVVGMAQDAERLSEALKLLPEAQRVLVERAFYGDLSHSEIATETGLPLGTVKSRIRLALERLRHALS